MRFHLSLFLAAIIFWAVAHPEAALAVDQQHIGDYSFILPEGFEARYFEDNGEQFGKTMILNQPFNQRDFGQAIVYCLREKKTEYKRFTLPGKERIYLQMGQRRQIPVFITATEDVAQYGLNFKFSLLEERSINSREIKDREYFFVVIEMDASNDDFHTLLFICDLRKNDGFFDADEYKSQVTGAAVQLLDSIKKRF
ncbi:MAG: hypothetical protein LBD82_02680 [Deltaproteobacteria bacterium]|jgi:hypothetical protein|nr:hypothetical protein [Deltaproteobacteria bacterium]